MWVPTVFTKNRDRLLTTEMSRKLMAAILAHEKVAPLLSDDHFSVDGTLVEAWASFKSFRPKSPTSDAPPPDADPPPPASTGAGRKAYDTAGTGAGEMTKSDGDTSTSEPIIIGRNVERNWRGQAWSNATTPQSPIPTHDFTARPKAAPRNFATWATP